jgi:hypothetical protein
MLGTAVVVVVVVVVLALAAWVVDCLFSCNDQMYQA